LKDLVANRVEAYNNDTHQANGSPLLPCNNGGIIDPQTQNTGAGIAFNSRDSGYTILPGDTLNGRKALFPEKEKPYSGSSFAPYLSDINTVAEKITGTQHVTGGERRAPHNRQARGNHCHNEQFLHNETPIILISLFTTYCYFFQGQIGWKQ